MPGYNKPVKYPWGKLAVGQSVDVYDVPSMASVYSSLRHWRDCSFRMGLDYTERLCPQFRMSHNSALGSVTITRVPDGPLQSIARVELAEAERAKKKALLEKCEKLDRLEWNLLSARAEAARAGLPLPLPSPELLQLAREVNPATARQLAQMTRDRLDYLTPEGEN